MFYMNDDYHLEMDESPDFRMGDSTFTNFLFDDSNLTPKGFDMMSPSPMQPRMSGGIFGDRPMGSDPVFDDYNSVEPLERGIQILEYRDIDSIYDENIERDMEASIYAEKQLKSISKDVKERFANEKQFVKEAQEQEKLMNRAQREVDKYGDKLNREYARGRAELLKEAEKFSNTYNDSLYVDEREYMMAGREAEKEAHRRAKEEARAEQDQANRNLALGAEIANSFNNMGQSAMDLSMSGVGFLSNTGFDKWRGGF